MSKPLNIDTISELLPKPMQVPDGVILPFKAVNIVDNIAYISGHIPQNLDGTIADTKGRVGEEVSLSEAIHASRLTGLAILASLKRELGDLRRIERWISAFGMVNTSPEFNQYPAVINGFSDLIIEVFGPETGAHSRSAIGVAGLPFNAPVEIEAQIRLKANLSV